MLATGLMRMFVSNTATATMIIPLLAALSVTLDVHPMILMASAAMAANCAFILPVGTPPNAIVFGFDVSPFPISLK